MDSSNAGSSTVAVRAEAGRQHGARRLARTLSQFLTSSALCMLDSGTMDNEARLAAQSVFNECALC